VLRPRRTSVGAKSPPISRRSGRDGRARVGDEPALPSRGWFRAELRSRRGLAGMLPHDPRIVAQGYLQGPSGTRTVRKRWPREISASLEIKFCCSSVCTTRPATQLQWRSKAAKMNCRSSYWTTPNSGRSYGPSGLRAEIISRAPFCSRVISRAPTLCWSMWPCIGRWKRCRRYSVRERRTRFRASGTSGAILPTITGLLSYSVGASPRPRPGLASANSCCVTRCLSQRADWPTRRQ
jgi:hypothetical protein